MIVKFQKSWRGIPAGSIMDITDNFARMDLIPRGIAVEIPPPGKSIDEPPVDKMVKTPRGKKRSVKI